LAREQVRQARASGVALTHPGGLLKSATKLVIETVLEEEMSEHLRYDKHATEGRNRGNSRNVKRSKTVLSDAAGAVASVGRTGIPERGGAGRISRVRCRIITSLQVDRGVMSWLLSALGTHSPTPFRASELGCRFGV